MRALIARFRTPPVIVVVPVRDKFWLDKNGCRAGEYDDINAAVAEKQTITGVNHWQRIVSERAA